MPSGYYVDSVGFLYTIFPTNNSVISYMSRLDVSYWRNS